MFGRAFWGARYFGPRYWGDGGTGTPVVPVAPEQGVMLRPGGIGHKGKSRADKDTRRRRILLEDGRIITPRDDAEYRRIVEDIIAERPSEAPATPRRRRIKGAVVTPTVPKLAPVQALPNEFYTALEFHRQGVLNYLSILSAWQAYLAARDEEEAVEMLLMVS